MDTTALCQGCLPGYDFDITRYCKASCKTGTYWGGKSNNQCFSCSSLPGNSACSTCKSKGPTCLTCRQGYLMMPGTDFCQKTCRANQYWTGRGSNTCLACSAVGNNFKCAECVDLTGACSKCFAGYHKLSQNDHFCRKSCTRGFYWSGRGGNECSKCSVNCSECQDVSGRCLRCMQGFVLNADFGLCRPVCGAGEYWLGSGDNRCQSCDLSGGEGMEHCSACEDVSGACTECRSGFVLDSETKTCRKSCFLDEYWNGEKCLMCRSHQTNEHCYACSDRTAKCLKCDLGFFLFQAENENFEFCRRSCQRGEYWTGRALNTCPRCSEAANNQGCGDCEDKTAKCRSCLPGYLMSISSPKKCVNTCPDAEEYLKEVSPGKGRCERCDESQKNPKCKFCENLTGSCFQCKKGYELVPETRFCKKICSLAEYWKGEVDNTCSKCSEVDEGNVECSECEDLSGRCSSCSEGFEIFDLKSGEKFCKKRCLEVEYWLGDKKNVCRGCQEVPGSEKCWKCQDLSGKCSECLPGYLILQDGFCRKECLLGQYWTGREAGNTCKLCQNVVNQCKQCKDESGLCEACNPNFELIDPQRCAIDCGMGMYRVDGVDGGADLCKKCSEVEKSGNECIECLTNSGECVACQEGFFVDGDGFCQKICQKNEFWSGKAENQCLACSADSEGCLDCEDVTGLCKECSFEYELKLTPKTAICEPRCPKIGYFWSLAKNRCLRCPEFCSTCEAGTGTCRQCFVGYRLDSGAGECQEVPENEKPGLEAVFFDKEDIGLVFAFDRDLDEQNTPQYMSDLVVELLVLKKDEKNSKKKLAEKSGKNGRVGGEETAVKVNEPEFVDGREVESTFLLKIAKTELVRKSKILFLELPKKELNSAVIKVRSRIPFYALPEASEKKIEPNFEKSKNGENGKKMPQNQPRGSDPTKNGLPEGSTAPESPQNDQNDEIFGQVREVIFNVTIKNVRFYESPSTETFAFYAQMLSICLKLGNLISAFFSLPVFFLLIHINQLASLPTLISTSLPVNSLTFSKHFKTNFLTIFGEINFLDISRSKCSMDEVFYRAGLSCVVINSSAMPVITLVLIFGALGGVLFELKERLEISAEVLLRVLLYTLMAAQVDALVASLLNLRFFDFSETGKIVSFLVALVTILTYLGVIGALLWQLWSWRADGERSSDSVQSIRKKRKFIKIQKFGEIEQGKRLTVVGFEFRDEIRGSTETIATILLIFVLNWLISIIVVFGSKSPIFQLCALSACFLGVAGWFVVVKPYKNLFGLAQISQMIGMSVVLMITLISLPEVSSGMSEAARFHSDGFIVVFMLGFLILGHLGIGGFLCFLRMKKVVVRWRKARGARKDQGEGDRRSGRWMGEASQASDEVL